MTDPREEEGGDPTACMFCGESIDWRDVEPLYVTLESAPGASRQRDVWGFEFTMHAHVRCLTTRLDEPTDDAALAAALKRLHPPGST
jgi:hypothetical protein